MPSLKFGATTPTSLGQFTKAYFGGELIWTAAPTGYTIGADGGSYAITGGAATLRRAYVVGASGGSYAITGADVSLRQSAYSIGADGGSYSITGAGATLRQARLIAASGGSYSITGSAVTLTYGTTDELEFVAGARQTSSNFTGLNFGAAATGRVMIAAIIFSDDASTASINISSVTIGGVTATRRARGLNSNTYRNVEFWTATVDTGTSGDVNITMSGAGAEVWIVSLYRGIGISETPSSINEIGTSASGNITIPANGFALCAGVIGSTGLTMTGVATKDYATGIGEPITSAPASEFYHELSTPGTTITPTLSGGSTGRRLVAAAWAF